MDHYQSQVIRIGIICNFLNFAGLCVLNKHDVLHAVVEPTDEDQFVKRRCAHLLRERRHERERVSLPDFLIAIRFETGRNLFISAGNGERYR